MDTKLAYTIEEAIEAGAGSRTVVYEAIKARTLKARKRGKRTIILSEDLRAYLQSLPDFHGEVTSPKANDGEAAPAPIPHPRI